MKILLLIIVLISAEIAANSQNYIGLSRTKIINRYGKPDFKGGNYFVYFDPTEEGTNTYFFDEKNNCNSFVLTRSSNYLKDYQKMLNKEFAITSVNTYICKDENFNFKAELTSSFHEFQIRIAYKDENSFTFANDEN
jgi:hypothetical protein